MVNIAVELLEELRRGNVVLFCGAGISVSKDGLPGGFQLAQELGQRARLDNMSGLTLPEVAAAYELEMGHQSLIAYIVSRIEDPHYPPLPTHHYIATLPCKYIITTNWDTLIEEALREARKPFVKVVRDMDVSFANDEKVLLIKLHGSIEQKDSIIITGDDYYDVFTRLPETANLVRAYFATKTIVFIGFGLADEDFKRLYHEVVRNLGIHKRRAYAVQRDPTPFAIKYWQQKNVQVIASDATDFLAALHGQSSASTQPSHADQALPPPASPLPQTVPTITEEELHRLLIARLDLEELRTLCFDLGVDFDSLRGEGKAAKARELIVYFRNRNQPNLLIATLRRMRPDIDTQ